MYFRIHIFSICFSILRVTTHFYILNIWTLKLLIPLVSSTILSSQLQICYFVRFSLQILIIDWIWNAYANISFVFSPLLPIPSCRLWISGRKKGVKLFSISINYPVLLSTGSMGHVALSNGKRFGFILFVHSFPFFMYLHSYQHDKLRCIAFFIRERRNHP